MRTTIHLTDEAYYTAKAIACERNIGLGRAISQIIVSFANPGAPASRTIEFENGFPVVSIGRVVTSADVQKILEESE
jgi:hypothetical protein